MLRLRLFAVGLALVAGGVTKSVSHEGHGGVPTKGSKVTVHYTGTLKEGGLEFDSSRKRNQKFTFTLGVGQVIACWDEGVATMMSGSRRAATRLTRR